MRSHCHCLYFLVNPSIVGIALTDGWFVYNVDFNFMDIFWETKLVNKCLALSLSTAPFTNLLFYLYI